MKRSFLRSPLGVLSRCVRRRPASARRTAPPLLLRPGRRRGPSGAEAPEPSPEELKRASRPSGCKTTVPSGKTTARPRRRAGRRRCASRSRPSQRRRTRRQGRHPGRHEGQHRRPDSVVRDKYRHRWRPRVLRFQADDDRSRCRPGEGWYTELPPLSRRAAIHGHNNDPNGPADQRSTFYGQVFKGFVDGVPEAYGKVETVVIDNKAPKLPQDATVDLAILMREAHGMVNGGTLNTWLAEIHHALKPKGVLGIEQHRAPADANPRELQEGSCRRLVDGSQSPVSACGQVRYHANPKATKTTKPACGAAAFARQNDKAAPTITCPSARATA